MKRDLFTELMQGVSEMAMQREGIAEFKPTHWPPRPTCLCLAVRLGITRMLLERAQ